jgi:hypothetical protein
MKNTAEVTDGKPIAVLLQSISGVSAKNPLVAFYDIHGGKREVLFFYFVSDTTRDIFIHPSSNTYRCFTSTIDRHLKCAGNKRSIYSEPNYKIKRFKY